MRLQNSVCIQNIFLSRIFHEYFYFEKDHIYMSILDRDSYITIDRTIIYMNAISYTRFITKEQYIEVQNHRSERIIKTVFHYKCASRTRRLNSICWNSRE